MATEQRVPWVPTPSKVIEFLLNSLGIGPGDAVLDLGCGDGRLLVAAAKRGATGICIEIDRVMCNITEIAATIAGVRHRIKILCRDFFSVDLREVEPRPSVVYAYLFSSILSELAPKLEEELEPGTIIVTLDFAIRGWSPFFAKPIVDEYGHSRVLWFYLLGLSNPSARYVGVSREHIAIARKLRGRSMELELW